MNSIDITDLVEVEKVERYIDLVKAFRKINKIINKEGESVTEKNGSQVFVKAHPLISERNKINSSLIALDRQKTLEQFAMKNGVYVKVYVVPEFQ
ncbi:P27 family phage terminase small subunit [Bacillus cereus]|uniref:P27 family phage terminase small subunit n=1 Tax=Bacillus cereus TaxID=1396 RepID=UPI00366BBBB7